MSDSLSLDQKIELRKSHLEMIQTVISRMAGVSVTMKNYCVTITAALLALYSQKPSIGLGYCTFFVIAMFGLIDSRYLSQERAFRKLYDEVRARSLDLPTDFYLGGRPRDTWETLSVIFSWSILWFYPP